MDSREREERRRNFRFELYTLKENGYLSSETVDEVSNAHHQFYLDLLEAERKDENENTEAEEHVNFEMNTNEVAKAKPLKVKKVLSPEEVRERNITWSLNIGVIFLLIGGLFVATSNWDSMTSLMKSAAIAAVAFLFYGLAYISKRVLKIEKTGFAFIVLGSLFLPIFILSLGWFGLLGAYLSINGDGKYFLGVLGSILPGIIYIIFAHKLQSRLFVWFSYLTTVTGFSFLMAAIHFQTDMFYLGIMLFNAAAIVVYHYLKKEGRFPLFTKELVPFTQVNLVLSTLFMLFIFNDHVFHGFNVIITAIIYLSMMFVTGRKEFHFVFSAMIVYGFYQLIEHSMLETTGPILYAAIGLAFLFVPQLLGDTFQLKKAFQYTSAAVSALAFLYISLEGMLLQSEKASWVLSIAYFVVAINFIYLANVHQRILFRYLSSFFLARAIFEGFTLADETFIELSFTLCLFLTGFLLMALFCTVQTHKIVHVIKGSSRDLSVVIMIIGIFLAEGLNRWGEVAVMFILFAGVAFILFKTETRGMHVKVSKWAFPVSLGLSVASFGELLGLGISDYHLHYGYSLEFAGAGLLLLAPSFLLKKTGEEILSRTSFYSAMGIYSVSILLAFIPVEVKMIQPLVLVGGIAMFSLLYSVARQTWTAFALSAITLVSYFSAWDAFIGFTQYDYIRSTGAALLIFILSLLFYKKDKILYRAFSWTGHSFLPLSLMIALLLFGFDAFISFSTAIMVYAISVLLATVEWKRKAFLYGAFTSLFLSFEVGLEKFFDESSIHYSFMLGSFFIAIFWWRSNAEYRNRTVYYLVPFSMLGICSFLMAYPFSSLLFFLVLLYVGMLLVFLHYINWKFLSFIPLLLAWVATVEFTLLSNFGNGEFHEMLLTIGLGLLFLFIGRYSHHQLVDFGKNRRIAHIDCYTLAAFLYFGYAYTFKTAFLWTAAVPGLLIAYSLWLQRKRVTPKWGILFSLVAGIYLLNPYYSIVVQLSLPSLWEAEIYVLPIVASAIFSKIALKDRYENITNRLQWAVLVIVALLLVQDGLRSSTIYDAIILGSLALISMVAGMYLRIKSYFFVGAGVLLLNLLLQTRPYWGNMPWWGYLLIAGSTLIGVASYNEWHKQKQLRGEATILTYIKEKVIKKLREWK